MPEFDDIPEVKDIKENAILAFFKDYGVAVSILIIGTCFFASILIMLFGVFFPEKMLNVVLSEKASRYWHPVGWYLLIAIAFSVISALLIMNYKYFVVLKKLYGWIGLKGKGLLKNLSDEREKNIAQLMKLQTDFLSYYWVRTDKQLFEKEKGAVEVFVAIKELSYEKLEEYRNVVKENIKNFETKYFYLMPNTEVNKRAYKFEYLEKIISELNQEDNGKEDWRDTVMERFTCRLMEGINSTNEFPFFNGFEYIVNPNKTEKDKETKEELTEFCFLYIPRYKQFFNFLMDAEFAKMAKELFWNYPYEELKYDKIEK